MSTTSSATGDIKNNVSKLLRELKRMNMKIEPNIRGLLLGIPSAFLPILHSSLMSYSLPLAQHLASLGIELYGRSDLRFVEGLYKVLRDVFDYHPKISRTQFLSIGFAECKIILTVDVLKLCNKKHMELSGVNPHKTHFKSKRLQQQQHRSSSSIGSSFSTVHTVAPSAGIGSVWQEAVPTSSSSTSSITPKPHLPLSPPVSPVQLTHANKGPVIIPEPVLELTPMSTPMKTTSSINHSSSSSGPSVDHVPHKIDHAPHTIDHTSHLVDHVSHDKEVDVSNMLNSNGSDVEIVTVESDIKLDGDPLDEEHVSHSIIANNMGYITEVTKRIEDTMELLDRLTSRMTFAESQLKVLQDKGVTHSKVTFRDICTQTDPLPEGQPPGIEAPPVMTSSPHTNVTTPILVKDTPTQYSRHRHYSSSSSSSSDPPSPVKINFNHPIDEEDTKKILTSLRTRAQQTKELLNKANYPTVTDLLINPVN